MYKYIILNGLLYIFLLGWHKHFRKEKVISGQTIIHIIILVEEENLASHIVINNIF